MNILISVDLDNYQDYQRLVGTKPEASPLSFYEEAVPRYLDLFDRHGIRGTFFATGRDLGCAANRRVVREIAARGHEVGNHSYSHPHNFRQLTRAQKAAEVDRSEAAIADAIGERPMGFRVPSSDVDHEILEVLAERDYLYDSSIVPTPVMWAFMLYGKLFVSRPDYQLGALAAAFAPNRPYRPALANIFRDNGPSSDGGLAILEIPISCARLVRIPFYSTLLRRLGRRFFSMLAAGARARGGDLTLIHHAIEMADLRGTALGKDFERMPGLDAPLHQRARFLEHVAATMVGTGEFTTMRDYARAWWAEGKAAA